MEKKYLKVKRFWSISSFALLVLSCTTNKNQRGDFPETEVLNEVEIGIIQADTFSGKIPKKIEMEISNNGTEFFEVKHKGPEQSKIDSIKDQKNSIKTKNKK